MAVLKHFFSSCSKGIKRTTSFLLAASLFAGTARAQKIITTVAGQLKSACSVEPCGDGGLAKDAKLYSPSGMAVDQNGNVYIAEFSRHAVRKIDKQMGIIITVAGKNCITKEELIYLFTSAKCE